MVYNPCFWLQMQNALVYNPVVVIHETMKSFWESSVFALAHITQGQPAIIMYTNFLFSKRRTNGCACDECAKLGKMYQIFRFAASPDCYLFVSMSKAKVEREGRIK